MRYSRPDSFEVRAELKPEPSYPQILKKEIARDPSILKVTDIDPQEYYMSHEIPLPIINKERTSKVKMWSIVYRVSFA